jgi:hypothetical protein
MHIAQLSLENMNLILRFNCFQKQFTFNSDARNIIILMFKPFFDFWGHFAVDRTVECKTTRLQDMSLPPTVNNISIFAKIIQLFSF